MTTWFTSDLHLGHANILKYSNRPFSDVVEMDNKLIHNWNERIGQYDHVWFLGDFCFTNIEKGQEYLNRLNGIKHLIIGNHDKVAVQLKGWTTIDPLKEIKLNGQWITLCHYAMRIWNKSHYKTWHLYGHSHGSLPDDPNSLSFDVGVDCHNYMPLSFQEVEHIMNKKSYKSIDHHGEENV
jgi:calcineurin-like phosphoesterase family protein